MIVEIKELAESLQDKLNEGNLDPLSDGIDNTRFEFVILPEVGMYKKPSREGNTVTYYINGIMRVIGSQSEGTNSQTVNSSISTAVELMIPIIQRDDDTLCETFVSRVRNWINQKLVYNVAQIDNVNGYFIGTEYKIAQTGTREILPLIGDCVKMTVYIDYLFVAGGVSSDDIKVTICEEPLYPTNLGISRRALTEGNITNDKAGVSRALVSGTAFVINASMPLRTGVIDKKLIQFTLDPAKVGDLEVKVTFPEFEGVDYTMTISSCHINGEIGLNASVTFELVEVI